MRTTKAGDQWSDDERADIIKRAEGEDRAGIGEPGLESASGRDRAGGELPRNFGTNQGGKVDLTGIAPDKDDEEYGAHEH
jgi:hypothetical protein